jgi:Bacterial Ig-like domain (group 3)
MGGTALCRGGLRAWVRCVGLVHSARGRVPGHRRARKPATGAALALAFSIVVLSVGVTPAFAEPADTDTLLMPSPSSSVVTGQPVTICATVTVRSNLLRAKTTTDAATGTVTFTGPNGLNQTEPVSNACVTITTPATGTVTGTYSGDVGNSGSFGTLFINVDMADTTTTVSATPDPSVTGQSVDVCAIVAAQSPGSGTPTGSVEFTDTVGGPMGTQAIAGGEACVTTTSLSNGIVTGHYNGDSGFLISTGTTMVSVGPAPTSTTTTVTASPTTAVVGQSVSVCAAVTAATGIPRGARNATANPTGSVVFAGTAGLTGTVPLNGSSQACTTSTTLVTGTITAAYTGTGGFPNSQGEGSVTVNPAATTTTVTASPPTSVVGQSVSTCAAVTATAMPRGARTVTGIPTGSVTFAGTAGLTGSVSLNGSGQACTTSTTLVTGTITAAYTGVGGFASSDGSASVTVNPMATTTNVTGPASSVVGQSVTVCATVTAGMPRGARTTTGIPTGSVTFAGTAGLTGTVSLDSSGQACATSTTLVTGTASAAYTGAGGYDSSDSTAWLTVHPAATTTTVTATPNPSVIGQSVEVCAVVTVTSPGGGTPTGTMTFNGAGLLQSEALDGSGSACATTTSLTSGTINATYDGTAEYTTSTNSVTVTVTAAPVDTTTVLTVTPNPSHVGDSVELCATVTVDPPNSGIPAGTVTFDQTSGLEEPVVLDGTGVACLTTTELTDGTVHANYAGAAGFTASVGTMTANVNRPAATATSVTATPNPSVIGQSVTVCATVTLDEKGGGGGPTGTVTFTGPGGLNQTVTLNGSSQACFSSTSLVSGIITATFNDNEDYATSDDTVTVTVTAGSAATRTAVTATPNPSVIGQSVTVCAAVTVDNRQPSGPAGTVTFTGAGLNQTVTLAAGQACLTTTTLVTGSVTAVYNGGTGFTGSTGTASVTVNSAPTTTVLTAARTGNSVELCATVTASSTMTSFLARAPNKPTGTVTFAGLSGPDRVATLDSDGRVCVTVTDTDGGTATATYSGGGGLAGSMDTAAVSPVAPTAGPPRNVTTVAGSTSITVSWDPPATGPTVTGYTATASPGPGVCTTTGATSCVLGAIAGTTYTVTVVAQYADGSSPVSDPSSALSPVAVTPPSTPPDTDLTLTTDQGDITVAAPGQDIVFIGTGFLAYSTVVVTIYSDPIVLGTVTTDGDGNFHAPITVPASLASGQHTIVAQGVAPDGSPRAMALKLTVAVGRAILPITGPPITLLLIGIVLAIAGTSLVTGARPRRRRRLL